MYYYLTHYYLPNQALTSQYKIYLGTEPQWLRHFLANTFVSMFLLSVLDYSLHCLRSIAINNVLYAQHTNPHMYGKNKYTVHF